MRKRHSGKREIMLREGESYVQRRYHTSHRDGAEDRHGGGGGIINVLFLGPRCIKLAFDRKSEKSNASP